MASNSQEKKLLFLADYADRGEIAILDYLSQHIEGFDSMDIELSEIKEVISSVQKEKGEPGESIKGEPGEDYILTDSDKAEIAKSIEAPVVEKIVEKIVEKTEVIREQPIVTNEVVEVEVADTSKIMVELEASLPQFGGHFRDGLELLADGDKLRLEAIEGLPKVIDSLRTSQDKTDKRIGGGSTARNLYQLADVTLTDLSDDDILQYNTSLKVWENVTPQSIEDVHWGEIMGDPSNQLDLTLQTVTDNGATTTNEITVPEVIAGGIPLYEILGNRVTTGVIDGAGFLTANVDTTKFDIADGYGVIVDALTDPENPDFTRISMTSLTGITPTYAANFVTYIAIQESGTPGVGEVVQQATNFTNSQRRDLVVLGAINTADGVNVTSTSDDTHSIGNGYLAGDSADAIGMINIQGNSFGPASTDLTLRKEAGESFEENLNRAIDQKDPNFKTSPVEDPATWIYIYSDGSGGLSLQLGQTDINPDQYDDGSGVLATVNNNRWTNQLVYFFPDSNTILVQFGEEVYQNLAAAEAAIPTLEFTQLDPSITSASLRTIISVKKGETDLGSSDTHFVQTGKFGFGGGGGTGGGGTFQDFQDIYGNSVTPQITTTVAGGALALKRGTALDTDDVTEIQNGAGTQVASTTGEGKNTATSFVKSGGASSEFLKADGSVDSSTYLTTIPTHTGEVTGGTALTLDKTAISNQSDTTMAATDILLFGDTSDSASLKKGAVQDVLDLVPATTPAGSDGDLQINASGSFGTIDGINLDQTGNARGTNALDIQSSRSADTDVAAGTNDIFIGINNSASAYYGGFKNNCTLVGINNNISGSGYYGNDTLIGYSNSSSSYYGQSSAVGYNNTCSGPYSNAIGRNNESTENRASAFGSGNISSAASASAFGNSNTASGQNSGAFGSNTTAAGLRSNAIGFSSKALANRSCAFGYICTASGYESFSSGVEQASYADSNVRIGGNSAFFNINTTGFSVNNMNALAGLHATSDLLVTDIESLGSEKVTNGTFTGSAAGWTLGTGWAYASNKVTKNSDGTGTLSQDVSAVAGEYYLLTFDISNFTAGTLDISLGGDTSIEQLNADSQNTNRTYQAVLLASTTGDLIFTPSNTNRITTIDNVSVKKITGGDVDASLGEVKTQAIRLTEITTPSAETNFGKVYTKTDNKLYFQDGAGVEHEIAFV